MLRIREARSSRARRPLRMDTNATLDQARAIAVWPPPQVALSIAAVEACGQPTRQQVAPRRHRRSLAGGCLDQPFTQFLQPKNVCALRVKAHRPKSANVL